MEHRQQNDIHEVVTDKALSLAKNIFYNKIVDKTNPYFIKKKGETVETDYNPKDHLEF